MYDTRIIRIYILNATEIAFSESALMMICVPVCDSSESEFKSI